MFLPEQLFKALSPRPCWAPGRYTWSCWGHHLRTPGRTQSWGRRSWKMKREAFPPTSGFSYVLTTEKPSGSSVGTWGTQLLPRGNWAPFANQKQPSLLHFHHPLDTGSVLKFLLVPPLFTVFSSWQALTIDFPQSKCCPVWRSSSNTTSSLFPSPKGTSSHHLSWPWLRLIYWASTMFH